MAIMTLPPLYLGDITRFNLIHSGRDVDPDGVDPDPIHENKTHPDMPVKRNRVQTSKNNPGLDPDLALLNASLTFFLEFESQHKGQFNCDIIPLF